jgi:hypothetical protein
MEGYTLLALARARLRAKVSTANTPGGYALNAKTNPRSVVESTKVPENEPRTNLNAPKLHARWSAQII